MLPENDQERKAIRLSNQWRVFPKATVALAKHIQRGGDKYCNGVPEWDRSKSPEDLESMLRHCLELVNGKEDEYTLAAIAWRAMAILEKHMDKQDFGRIRTAEPEPKDYVPAILAEFLRSEGVLEEFLELEEGDGWWNSPPCKWLYNAFIWRNSDVDLWIAVNRRWMATCEELDKEDA